MPDTHIVLLPPSWPQLLEIEREARYSVLGDPSSQIGSVGTAAEPEVDAIRAWFAHASHILSSYTASCRYGTSVLVPPVELMHIFAQLSDSFSRGIIPKLVSKAAAGSGRKGGSNLEEKHVGWATLYIQSARSGKIDDKNPIKTVMEVFGVTRQSAQRWGTREVPASLKAGHDPEWIIRQTHSAGAFYKQAGRSASALNVRGAREPEQP